jgi:hypothetical protein
MKRVTLLAALLASVSFAAPAFAQNCDRGGCEHPDPLPDLMCVSHPRDDSKRACVEEEYMSNSERLDVYNLFAQIERRADNKAKAEAEERRLKAAAEEARLAQCRVRWLGIGCPPKK